MKWAPKSSWRLLTRVGCCCEGWRFAKFFKLGRSSVIWRLQLPGLHHLHHLHLPPRPPKKSLATQTAQSSFNRVESLEILHHGRGPHEISPSRPNIFTQTSTPAKSRHFTLPTRIDSYNMAKSEGSTAVSREARYARQEEYRG